jgi:hypothetical protein
MRDTPIGSALIVRVEFYADPVDDSLLTTLARDAVGRGGREGSPHGR